jgi:pimeloyl-ACP methyl ester carboxylesterase
MYSSVVTHLRGFNVYGIDFRSHGLSERGDVSDWNGFQRDVEAAFAEISNHSHTETFIGVGISSGASAHILNAAHNSTLYDRLILCEPIMFAPGADLSHRQALAMSAQKRRSDFASKDEVFQRFSERGSLSHLSASALGLYATYGFVENEIGVTLRCHKSDEEAIYLSGAANGVYEALDKISVPTLLVYGEHSTTVTEESATDMAEHIDDVTVTCMQDVGHFTLFENPILGAEIIENFLISTKAVS